MFEALREPGYRRFWVAQFVSNVGTWMQNLAQGWLVLSITGSPLLLGVVGFASSIPTLFLMLPGGVLADQVDRRRLLRFAQSAQALSALVLALLIWIDVIAVWQIITLAVVSGIAVAFASPTYQALVLDLVRDRALLANAVALNSLQFNLSRVAGPMLAGLALSELGVSVCFLLNALSFIPVIFVLRGMRDETARRIDARELITRLAGGFAYVRESPLVQLLLGIVAVASFFGYPYVTLLPALARAYFDTGPSSLAILMGSMGLGAMSGSLYLAARHKKTANRVGLVIGLLAAFATGLVIAVSASSFRLTVIGLFLCGFSMVTCIGSVNTLLQHMIPDELRGRVLSMYTFSFFGFLPFGNLLSGWLAERWGVSSAFLVMGGSLYAGAGLALWRWRRIR